MSTGTTSLYGTGLDFSSVFPRLSRPRATLLIGLISCALIFIGRFYFTLISSITTFVSLIVVTTTPWMVIMMIGYVARRRLLPAGGHAGFLIVGKGWAVRTGSIEAGTSPAWPRGSTSAIAALLMVNRPGHFVGILAQSSRREIWTCRCSRR